MPVRACCSAFRARQVRGGRRRVPPRSCRERRRTCRRAVEGRGIQTSCQGGAEPGRRTTSLPQRRLKSGQVSRGWPRRRRADVCQGSQRDRPPVPCRSRVNSAVSSNVRRGAALSTELAQVLLTCTTCSLNPLPQPARRDRQDGPPRVFWHETAAPHGRPVTRADRELSRDLGSCHPNHSYLIAKTSMAWAEASL